MQRLEGAYAGARCRVHGRHERAGWLLRSRRRGQAGRLEVWYTTLTDPATGTGLRHSGLGRHPRLGRDLAVHTGRVPRAPATRSARSLGPPAGVGYYRRIVGT